MGKKKKPKSRKGEKTMGKPHERKKELEEKGYQSSVRIGRGIQEWLKEKYGGWCEESSREYKEIMARLRKEVTSEVVGTGKGAYRYYQPNTVVRFLRRYAVEQYEKENPEPKTYRVRLSMEVVGTVWVDAESEEDAVRAVESGDYMGHLFNKEKEGKYRVLKVQEE